MRLKSCRPRLFIIFLALLVISKLAAQNFSHRNYAPQSSSRFSIRINVGGDRYVDSNGQEWLADHIYGSDHYGYLGISGTYSSRNPIKGTADPTIYQSERYKLFGYRVKLPNGHYLIKLHFAEIYHEKTGRRLFDIKIEGQTVQKNLDIFEMSGKNKALVLTFDTQVLGIPVVDNRLDIDFINKRDDTKLSGIEVIQQADQPALLQLNPPKIEFDERTTFKTLEISNIGSDRVPWKIKSPPRWLKTPLPQSGTLDAGETERIRLEIRAAEITGGITTDSVVVTGPDFRQAVTLQVVVSGPPRLVVDTPQLEFQSGLRQLSCVLRNTGGSDLKWAFARGKLPRWIKRIYPRGGVLPMGKETFVNVTISRSALPAGTHQQILLIKSNSGSQKLLAKVTVPTDPKRKIFVAREALGQNDGSSWKNAFTSIEKALEYARQLRKPLQIWVAQGIYYEHGLHIPSGVELYGGFLGDETTQEERQNSWLHQTIVDGELRGRCFEAAHKTLIDGFVIQNGRDWNSGDGKGAAILTYDADVVIRNNLIRDNIDSWAGAIFIEGFDLKKKVKGVSPLIERNVLINNVSNYCAAAIEIRGSAATIRHNTIVRNHGYGLEIQDLLGPYQQVTYGKFYNNIITENKRHSQPNDVWAEARKATNYSFISTRWHLKGAYPPYNYGKGNIFAEESRTKAGFVDPENSNFRLRADSPVIDAGAPTAENDPDGSRADLGAFPFHKNDSHLEIATEAISLNQQTRTQTIVLKGFGGKTVPWQAQITGGRLLVQPKSGVIGNGDQIKVKITAPRSGNFEGYLAFLTPMTSQEIPFSVNMDPNAPIIAVSPEQLVVSAELKGRSPVPEQIKIRNTGGSRLSWVAMAKSTDHWLKLRNTTGASGQPLDLFFETSHLGYGNYHAEIKIVAAGAVNRSVSVPVKLEIRPGKYIFEIQAEDSRSLPNKGWVKTQQGENSCLKSMYHAPRKPNDSTRIDFEFEVPEGLEYVYIFAELDTRQSRGSDSFWAMVNEFDPCSWNYLDTKYRGWQREWVYNHPRDKKHMFVVIPGKNRFNLFSREPGACINWIVITSDPDLNIHTYRFGAN